MLLIRILLFGLVLLPGVIRADVPLAKKGDFLPGELRGCDETQCEVCSPNGGVLTLPRSLIASQALENASSLETSAPCRAKPRQLKPAAKSKPEPTKKALKTPESIESDSPLDVLVTPEANPASLLSLLARDAKTQAVIEGAFVQVKGASSFYGRTPFEASLPYGKYTIQVGHPNYLPETREILIRNDPVILAVPLKPHDTRNQLEKDAETAYCAIFFWDCENGRMKEEVRNR